MRLVLASASPRRAELLEAAGYAFEVHAVHLDERPKQDEAPADYVVRLAAEKSALALAQLRRTGKQPGHDELLIIGADTAVVLGREILGKPLDVQDAERMLRLLSGRSHEVLTGVSVRSAIHGVTAVDATMVWFAPLTEDEVAWYSASGEGLDKAGGYAIQGLASRFIPRIDGSYSNVVGLPISTLHRLIDQVAGQAHILASREQ
jgi:septum formation protein